MESEHQRPALLYIAGYGRSGSTLLDCLLDNHPAVIGTGELSWLFAHALEDRTCSCGQRMSSCPVWSVVLRQDEDSDRLSRLSELSRSVDARAWPARSKTELEQYAAAWGSVLDALGVLASADVVVDSSKTGRRMQGRLRALARIPGTTIHVVHLVRDPRAVMWSARRGSNSDLEGGRLASGPRRRMLRALMGWAMTNLSTEWALNRAHLQGGRMIVRYEDLADEPVAVLGEICALVGAEPLASSVWSEARPGHGIAGNRMRRRGLAAINLDDEWSRSANWLLRVGGVLSAPFAHRYGYGAPRTPPDQRSASRADV